MLFAQQEARPLFDFTLRPLFQDNGIPLAVMGVLIVFIALSLLVAFISLLPRFMPALTRFSQSESKQPGAILPVDDDELPDELVAVIAAAVSVTLGAPHRIVRIRGLTPEDLGWSLEGRMQHHQSHRIRHADGR